MNIPFRDKIPKFDRFTTVKISKLAALGMLYGHGPRRVAGRVVVEMIAAAALYNSAFSPQAQSGERYYQDREAQNYKLKFILLEKNLREFARNTDNAQLAAQLRTLLHRTNLEAES